MENVNLKSLFAYIMIFFIVVSVIPALLTATNDMAVMIGVISVICGGAAAAKYWKEIITYLKK